MDKKHYKKYLKQLIDAGISKAEIERQCNISIPTIKKVLDGEPISTRLQRNIADGYDKIVSNFISLK